MPDTPDWIAQITRAQRLLTSSPVNCPTNITTVFTVTPDASARGLMVLVAGNGVLSQVSVTGHQSGVTYGLISPDFSITTVICPISTVLDTSYDVAVSNGGVAALSAWAVSVDDVVSTGFYAEQPITVENIVQSVNIIPPVMSWHVSQGGSGTGAINISHAPGIGHRINLLECHFSAMQTGTTAIDNVITVHDGSSSGTVIAQAVAALGATAGQSYDIVFHDLVATTGTMTFLTNSSSGSVVQSLSAWGWDT